ncbi:MAG: HAD family phosphatase [Clostridia bacterium]|nr:HAD family phosphatase [Clostridia bacterium]
MQNERAAIFDLDGTLLDSGGVWYQIDVDFMARRGLTLPADYGKAVSAMHLHEAAVYTIERFSLNETPEAVKAEWLAMAAEAYAHRVPLKPGAKEFLAHLKERGIPLAVATALARELAEPALKRHGIYDWFDALVYAAEVGQGKSSPAVYLRAAEQLGVSPEHCTVFEDTLVGVRTAKRAGMRTIAMADGGNVADRAAIQAVANGFWETFGSQSLDFFLQEE